MENEEAFEADAEVDTLSKMCSSSSHRSGHKGHDTLQAALGGFESHGHPASEETPLIPKSPGLQQLGFDKRTIVEEDDNGPPEWSGAHDFDGLPWWRRPSIYWLLPAFLLFTMAFGGTIVPKLNLILSLICVEYREEREMVDPLFHMAPVLAGSDNPQCQIPEVQALVSKFMLYSSLISGILSAIVSPKFGALSDRYGRKRIICLSTLGMLASEVITIIVARHPDMLSVYWILLGHVFDGLGGSFIAAMALSYAYASDCTVPEKRNVAFGYYHGCLFAGIALGPLFAAYIIGLTNNILSIFYLAIGAHGLFTLWLIFVVPESLTKERQMLAREKYHALSYDLGVGEAIAKGAWSEFLSHARFYLTGGNILAPLNILWPTEPGTNPALRRNLVFLAAVDTTMFGVAMGSMTVVIIYSEYVFNWGTSQSSVFVSIVNIGRVLVLLIFLPLATRLFRGPSSKAVKKNSGCDQIDLGIIRVAILFDMIGYIGYATVRSGDLFILSGVIAAVGGMGSPTLSAALTKHVPPERTGQVLGAMGLLHASARVVAPTIFNSIYAKTVGSLPQTVFVCLASTFGLALIFSLFIRPHVYWDQPHDSGSEDAQPIDSAEAEIENENEPLVR